MRFPAPHPIPYQGSKRRLATAILSQIGTGQYQRLVEPFAGSAAVTLAAASKNMFTSYVIGDVLDPLIRLWQAILRDPYSIAGQYESLWLRERAKPIDAYYEIRTEFNLDRDPSKLLYLLARCVKNAVRFNPSGEFNQSPDKRRPGTHPGRMKIELLAAYRILNGKCVAVCGDFVELFLQARKGDFFYLDPPYQGTSVGRDRRYVAGVSRERIIETLAILNERCVPFVLSYDGLCGNRSYGEPLPENLARQMLLHVGRSSQATLNGENEMTIESLYVSHMIARRQKNSCLWLDDFADQTTLFG